MPCCWQFPWVIGGRAMLGMEAAQYVIHELLVCCTQKALLACKRPLLSAGAVRNTRKPNLIADLVATCSSCAGKQRICSDLMAAWSKRERRLFIARLMGLGLSAAVGPRPRKQYLIATIIK